MEKVLEINTIVSTVAIQIKQINEEDFLEVVKSQTSVL